MYIKTITIQGFKSYRDQTQIEPFSPRHNVVVGRNGSGKSNFFAAIRFVLSDAYTSISREERQSLLHEGTSTANTLSAFVEVVFDNADSRFPTGHPEVILRRTVGLKKDEYSLDKKSVSKADVMNLLESAGFSRANPYYIVPQGRITALTNAKDHERLALLKEVAGTRVYEQRRTESLRIMDETDAKRNKIGELLAYIEERLTELEEEKEELKEFQDKDKDRRCLEYALYNRELQDIGEALDEIEEERRAEVHGANQRREQFSAREQEISDLERQISGGKHALQTLSLTRHGAQGELHDLVRSRTELECVVSDLQATAERSTGRRDALEENLETVEADIADKERQLSALLPEWEESRRNEGEGRRALEEVRARMQTLYAKRGRADRFRNKAERDTFLRGEIASIQSYQGQQQDALRDARNALTTARRALQEVDQKIEDSRQRADDGLHRVKTIGEETAKLKESQSELSERRKELWREDTKLDSLVRSESDQLRDAERALAGMMDKDTGMGLRAVDRIAGRPGFEGVYGPLYRLFEVTDSKYNTAIELTAGNSLFHVVVDTDETASRVLDIMIKEKTGRVTFMPLNRLKPKNPPLPSAQDAIPLIEKLRFNPEHLKAFQQVFGKTCVCRDLTVAAAYVKSHGINTITLDGDKVDRKGALTGGYHDVRRSRIDAIKGISTFRAKWEADDKRAKEVKRGIEQVDQEITRIAGRIQVLTNQQAQARSARDAVAGECATWSLESDTIRERTVKLEIEIQEVESEMSGLAARLQALQEELASPMARNLTDEEEDLLERLSKEVESRQKDLIELGRLQSERGSRRNVLEIELKEGLRRRRDEIQAKISEIGEARTDDDTSIDDLEARTRELKALNVSIEAATKRANDMERETENLSSELHELRTSLEKLQTHQADDSKSINRQQKSTERYMAKRQMLITRKDECNSSIRDLGVLPEEAFEKYTREKLDRLVKKLHVVNEGLKKFAHVNKKAFEQYSNFTKQRDQLLERREELDASARSIEELVEVLDQRKDEAIERTFKQVASNFEDVFEKLVPAGRGRLIIQRRIDRDEEVEEDGDNTQQTGVESYTGVSIKVSFNSKVDEGLRIQQLSGGQKSLVALALVFAIQKCDPAPFYLFDEIDANLDAQYRTAVASMIKSLASSGQFITTTFRPEMLVTADKFYGVLFNNQKVSSIRTIKREEAMEFVDQEAHAQ